MSKWCGIWHLKAWSKKRKQKTQDIWLCRCTGRLEGKVHGSESHNIMQGPGNRPSGCIGSHQGCSLATFCKFWWWWWGGEGSTPCGSTALYWQSGTSTLTCVQGDVLAKTSTLVWVQGYVLAKTSTLVWVQGNVLAKTSTLVWVQGNVLAKTSTLIWVQRNVLAKSSTQKYQQSGTSTLMCVQGAVVAVRDQHSCVSKGMYWQPKNGTTVGVLGWTGHLQGVQCPNSLFTRYHPFINKGQLLHYFMYSLGYILPLSKSTVLIIKAKIQALWKELKKRD